ncbi:hypothetical protein D7231_24200 [Streptomyces klenkii]|uniref:Uncharacterized protein n=1 Tax=Streptomyces klenkii TaxID=1420899 RepID=A0A3B0B4Z6_9ACTN|nr:hypothetical protein [Streptomyces klenkii]RKN65917.1 hypothetical protein D7231_24200 [Streptomyces klenkii]
MRQPPGSRGESQPLVVPLQIEALTVNERVRYAEVFQRWQANYALTRLNLSPEPPAFSNTDTAFNADPGREGVYLHWQLPEALTHGVDDQGDGVPVFPLVPNRWLVVRQAVVGAAGTRTDTGWIVESDYLHPAHGSSAYMDRDGRLTRIGRRVDLATGEWSEPGTPDGGLFLTAVGPGLPTFAAYQPYNTDVFSVHDRTDDLDPDTPYELNYLVAGWYSDPAADPLAGDLAARMAALNWTATGTAPDSARTVCHGTALDVQWQRRGSGMPASDRPDYVTVAVGNNTEHAGKALTEYAARRAGSAPQLAALISAAHSGVLDLLDEPDGQFQAERALHASWFTPEPGGYTWVLEDAEQPAGQAAERSAAPGGKRRRPRAVRSAYTQALAQLNEDQAAHDTALQDLIAAQRRLYDLWWAANLPKVPDAPGEPAGKYRDDLDKLVQDATRTAKDQRDRVARLRAAIPWGDTPEDLTTAIGCYQRDHGLPEDEVVLKRAVQPDHHRPNDPVVVIRGTKDRPLPPDPEHSTAVADPYAVPEGAYDDSEQDEDPPLGCRWPDALITGVRVAGSPVSATEAQAPKPPNLPAPEGLPGILPALLRELFHLASSNARTLATATGFTGNVTALAEAMRDPYANAAGTPGAYTAQWRQPWQPLFFEWKVDYFPIEWQGDPDGSHSDRDNWAFDGNEYHWLGTGAHTIPRTLSGRQFLTPAPRDTMADALRQYARTHPGPGAAALRSLARQVEDDADWLSQPLVGFTEQLAARGSHPATLNPHTELSPDLRTALTEATGRTLPPAPGALPRPFTGWNESLYQPLRAGQFAFARLAVIDRFGHALPAIFPDPRALSFAAGNEPGDVIGVGVPARRFAPELPEELTPSWKDPNDPGQGHWTINPPTWYRFTQLTPRLTQPARAGFTLLDARDDLAALTTASDPDATPVSAWLVPAHLDQALYAYGPDGAPLGELRTTLPPSGIRQVTWHALPYSQYRAIDDLREGYPHLHGFLSALVAQDRGPEALRALLSVIDRTLSTTAPIGDAAPPHAPSVLVGRPLALMRLRFGIDLDGPAYADPSWENLREAEPPAYPGYRWPVRLGERNELADGLVGYFHGAHRDTDYRVLHTVLSEAELPGEARDYFDPIGAGASLTLPARVPGSDPENRDAAFLTVLADPRGTVHATTDILPTAGVRLPARLVEPPLAELPVSFRLGPLPVSEYVPDASAVRATGEPPALVLPRPSDRHGTWTWVQNESAATWSEATTYASDGEPRHPHPAPTLRSGRLTLRPGGDADHTEGDRR